MGVGSRCPGTGKRGQAGKGMGFSSPVARTRSCRFTAARAVGRGLPRRIHCESEVDTPLTAVVRYGNKDARRSWPRLPAPCSRLAAAARPCSDCHTADSGRNGRALSDSGLRPNGTADGSRGIHPADESRGIDSVTHVTERPGFFVALTQLAGDGPTVISKSRRLRPGNQRAPPRKLALDRPEVEDYKHRVMRRL